MNPATVPALGCGFEQTLAHLHRQRLRCSRTCEERQQQLRRLERRARAEADAQVERRQLPAGGSAQECQQADYHGPMLSFACMKQGLPRSLPRTTH